MEIARVLLHAQSSLDVSPQPFALGRVSVRNGVMPLDRLGKSQCFFSLHRCRKQCRGQCALTPAAIRHGKQSELEVRGGISGIVLGFVDDELPIPKDGDVAEVEQGHFGILTRAPQKSTIAYGTHDAIVSNTTPTTIIRKG